MVVSDFVVLESSIFAVVCIGPVPCSCKPPARQMLFSVLQLFSLCEWKSVIPYTLKGQSFENGLSLIFQAKGNMLTSKQKQ